MLVNRRKVLLLVGLLCLLYCCCILLYFTLLTSSHAPTTTNTVTQRSSLLGPLMSLFSTQKTMAQKAKTALDRLWRKVDTAWSQWPAVGICRAGRSLLPADVPDELCQRRLCLYSLVHKRGIDIDKLVTYIPSEWTSTVHWRGAAKDCQQPRGGQAATKKGDIPQVSFLYTLHNNAELAATSILEVFRTAHEAQTVEFVVVDDGSDEDMAQVDNLLRNLQTFFGVSVTRIHNASPLGYGRSNNLGMKQARGEFVMLLNSDVLPLPGWLALLLRTVDRHPEEKLGMVGPMMLDKKGRVSEAGGGMYKFGIPFNTGRGSFPVDLPFQQAREVDYISAACLLVRRELFLQLNLFDDAFSPAYYEDTDAAFVHLEHGYRTKLQPLSVVFHFEGSTYGTSGTSTVKDDLMQRNSQLFRAKHQEALSNYCPEATNTVTREQMVQVHMAQSFYRQERRVLLLAESLPTSPSAHLFTLFQFLTVRRYSITFESREWKNGSVRDVLPLLAEGVSVVVPGALHDMATRVSSLPFFAHLASKEPVCPWDVVFITDRESCSYHWEDVKTLCPRTKLIFVGAHATTRCDADVTVDAVDTEDWNDKLQVILTDLGSGVVSQTRRYQCPLYAQFQQSVVEGWQDFWALSTTSSPDKSTAAVAFPSYPALPYRNSALLNYADL